MWYQCTIQLGSKQTLNANNSQTSTTSGSRKRRWDEDLDAGEDPKHFRRVRRIESVPLHLLPLAYHCQNTLEDKAAYKAAQDSLLSQMFASSDEDASGDTVSIEASANEIVGDGEGEVGALLTKVLRHSSVIMVELRLGILKCQNMLEDQMNLRYHR